MSRRPGNIEIGGRRIEDSLELNRRGRLFVASFVATLLMFAPLAFARGSGGGGGSGHVSGRSTGGVYVHGYTRKDGTYVEPYWRAAPSMKGSSSSGAGDVQEYWTGRRSVPGPESQSQEHWTSPPSRATGSSRGADGHEHRSTSAKDHFKKEHPCPSTGATSGSCPGYVIDHIVPLKRGGPDAPINMQWQTIEDAKAKDKWE
jgi:hypothetical protein